MAFSALNQKKFSEATGLSYNAQLFTYYGQYLGYYCAMTVPLNQGKLMFRVFATPEGTTGASISEEQSARMNAEFGKIASENKGVNSCIYMNNQIILHMVMPSKKTIESIMMIMDEVVRTCRAFSMLPCCESCGVTSGMQLYRVNGNTACFCSSCQQRAVEALEQNQQAQLEKRENPVMGFVGAFLGAVVVFILTYILWQLGYVAYITGAVGMFCAFTLYKKLGGKISLFGVVLATAICLASSIFTNLYCVGGVLADLCEEEQKTAQSDYDDFMTEYDEVVSMMDGMTDDDIAYYTSNEYMSVDEYMSELDLVRDEWDDYIVFLDEHATVMDCVLDLPSMLEEEDYAEAKGEIVENILWGVISILVTSIAMIPGLLRESKGKFVVELL